MFCDVFRIRREGKGREGLWEEIFRVNFGGIGSIRYFEVLCGLYYSFKVVGVLFFWVE